MDVADGFYDESVKGRLRGGGRKENTTLVLLLMFVVILHFGFVQMQNFNIIKAEWMRRGSQEDLEVQLQWGQKSVPPETGTDRMGQGQSVLPIMPDWAYGSPGHGPPCLPLQSSSVPPQCHWPSPIDPPPVTEHS